jgi:hypothetical protein
MNLIKYILYIKGMRSRLLKRLYLITALASTYADNGCEQLLFALIFTPSLESRNGLKGK